MPSNLTPTELGLAKLAQTESLPTTGVASWSISKWLITKGLGTFKGWVARKCVTLGLVASAATTAFISANWIFVEQFASKFGFGAEALAQLHQTGSSFAAIIGGLASTLILGLGDALLSRAAAHVTEIPMVPVAIPVEQTEDPDPTDSN